MTALGESAGRLAFLRPPFDLSDAARSADEFGADWIRPGCAQRIGPPEEYADKRLSLNAVTDTVRAMADAGGAVIVVSAVGWQRDTQGRSSSENLTLTSFRESSEWEYGADSACRLIRPASMLRPFPAAATPAVLFYRWRNIMRNVTIRRCPTCQTIGSRTDQLVADLRNDPDVKVNVVDGNKGEFTVEVDGRRIDGKKGESLRDTSDLAAEIRAGSSAVAV